MTKQTGRQKFTFAGRFVPKDGRTNSTDETSFENSIFVG